MSNFTTEIRYICESLYTANTGKDYADASISDIISSARTSIFDFPYTYPDADFKEDIETDILKSFYFREIGFETYARWKLALECKMHDIMPYYTDMVNSAIKEFEIVFVTEDETIDSGSTNNKITNLSNTSNTSESGNNLINQERSETGNTAKNSDFNETENGTKSEENKSVSNIDNKIDTAHSESSFQNNSDSSQTTTKNYASDTPQNNITDPLQYMSAYSAQNGEGETQSKTNTGSSYSDNKNENGTSTTTDTIAGTNNINKINSGNENINHTITGKNSDTSNYVKTQEENTASDKTENGSDSSKVHRVLKSTGNKNPYELVELYRKSVLRIKEMIMRELNPLFIGLWSR